MKTFLWLLFFALFLNTAHAETRIAVLNFELKDLTLLPNHPDELKRISSIKPLLTDELKKYGYSVVSIDETAAQTALMGKGYLFDHADIAAQLGKTVNADYVIVGRLHKPSFLFAYLLAQVVEVKSGLLIDSLTLETKGGEKKLTNKAVEALAEKIHNTLIPKIKRQ